MLNKIKFFLHSERGDTNIMEVLIILGIIIVLAGVFHVMVETGMEKIRELFESFLEYIGI
jgi:hypothetical protein